VTSRIDVPGRATEVALRDPTETGTLEGEMQPPRGRPARVRAVCLLALVSLLVVTGPVAAFETATVRRGACSGPSGWRLAVVRDAGLLRVRLAVRGGRAGQRWNVFMDDNGERFFAGIRISGSEGFWVVRRRVPNRAGPDRIGFGAHNVATGETCRGRAAA
jgi:hypothetical protein